MHIFFCRGPHEGQARPFFYCKICSNLLRNAGCFWESPQLNVSRRKSFFFTIARPTTNLNMFLLPYSVFQRQLLLHMYFFSQKNSPLASFFLDSVVPQTFPLFSPSSKSCRIFRPTFFALPPPKKK